MNVLKVGILLTVLTALLVFVGSLIGGTMGAVAAFVFAAIMNLGAFWFSDRMVLRMARARPITQSQAPGLYRMTERLAANAGLPMPRLYLIDDAQPNAFATGRNPRNAAVAVNQGLLDLLSPDEVEGVIAHELAHVKSRDTLTMSIVATIAGAVMLLSQFGQIAAFFGGGDEDAPNPLVVLAIALVAPIAATLVQLGISRAREYEADALGAKIAGTPTGLANALRKLNQAAAYVPSSMPASAAHLCIVNPFAGVGTGFAKLFQTHPPLEERVTRLLGARGGAWEAVR